MCIWTYKVQVWKYLLFACTYYKSHFLLRLWYLLFNNTMHVKCVHNIITKVVILKNIYLEKPLIKSSSNWWVLNECNLQHCKMFRFCKEMIGLRDFYLHKTNYPSHFLFRFRHLMKDTSNAMNLLYTALPLRELSTYLSLFISFHTRT